MGADHCRADIPVAQERLDRTDIVASLDQVGGKGVAEGITGPRAPENTTAPQGLPYPEGSHRFPWPDADLLRWRIAGRQHASNLREGGLHETRPTLS